MPNPEVRYCTTEDGVRIAYCVYGEGPPLIWCAEPQSSHLLLERQLKVSSLYSSLAEAFQVVRFDARGLGISDREVEDLSLAARIRDVEAVTSALHLTGFALAAGALSGSVAMSFAAEHPTDVTHLVLYDSLPRIADLFATTQVQAVASLLDHDWEMFTENVGTVIFGWEENEARQYGSFFRATMTPDQVRRYIAALASDDATSALARILAPSLVMYHTGLGYIGMDRMRDLVAQLPDARLLLMEGRVLDNLDQMVTAIADHCAPRRLQPSLGGTSPETLRVRTVLFTDLVGHTEMMQRLGDEQGRAVLRAHERITREVLKQHGGVEVKTMGDGFMASFGSVTKALECAVALQRAFVEHSESSPERLDVRVGLNAGEPIAEDGDLFGSTVILASRIAAQAGAGEILVADTIRGLASGKGFLFADRGEVVPKGFEEPVRLYEVRWQEEPS
jgi:class 3 adenylate cyclase